MRGRPCKVCGSERRRDIDIALAAGTTIKTIARQYGMSHGSVGRHKLNCCIFPTRTNNKGDRASKRAMVAEEITPAAAKFADSLIASFGVPADGGIAGALDAPGAASPDDPDNVAPVAKPAEEPAPTRDRLGLMVLAIHSRLDAIAKQCHDEGATALSISAIDKMRLSIETFARLQGMTGTGSSKQNNISVNVGIAVTAGEIVSALRAPLETLDLEALEEVSADG